MFEEVFRKLVTRVLHQTMQWYSIYQYTRQVETLAPTDNCRQARIGLTKAVLQARAFVFN